MSVDETEPIARNPATEDGRFETIPMCTNLTGDCARKFKAQLLTAGGDSVNADLESGRVQGSGIIYLQGD